MENPNIVNAQGAPECPILAGQQAQRDPEAPNQKSTREDLKRLSCGGGA